MEDEKANGRSEKEGGKTESASRKKMQIVGFEKEVQEISSLIAISFGREVVQEDLRLKGVVLYGPAGCGKTSIVKRVQEVNPEVVFIEVRLKNIVSKYQGESEQKLREIFQEAQTMQPCVLVMDDLQDLVDEKALGGQTALSLARSLEQEVDAMEGSQVMVLACCPTLDSLPASLRK